MSNQQWTQEQIQQYQQFQQQGYSDEQIQQYFFQQQQQQMQQQIQQNAGFQQNQLINQTNQQEIQQPQQFNPGYQTMNNFGMQSNFTQANQQLNQNLSYLMQQNSQLQQNYYAQEMQKQQFTQQIAQLTTQVKTLQTKLRGEEEEKEKLETEKQTNIKKLTTTINKLKQDIAELTEKSLDVEFDCKQKEDKFQKVLKQFKDEKEANQNMKKQMLDLQNTLLDKESDLQIVQKKFELTLSSSKSDTDNLFRGLNDEKTNEISRLKSQITQLKNELEEKNQSLKKTFEESEIRIKSLEEEVSKEHKYFLQSKEEVSNWQKKTQQMQNQIKQKDQNIEDLQKQISTFRQEIKKLQTENQNFKDNLILKDNEIAQQKKIIDQLQNYVKNPKIVNNDELKRLNEEMNQMKNNFANQQKQLNDKAQEKMADIEREKENQMKKMLDLQKQRNLKQQELKNSNKTLIKQLMSKATEVQGQLDICYVIDSTLSMEPYIQQARKCVRESLKIIKLQTNRDTNVSAICYYDIEQKPKQGFYHQLDFTKDAQVLEKFLDDIKTVGGRDPPEDVKGAFDQMLTNIKWQNKFRLAILITDAPCHGEKYHDPMQEYHKDSDITQTLHNIVKNGIILIGFNLNRITTKMYNEFEKVYKEIQKQDQFFKVDVQGQQVDKLAEQMAKTLGQASEQATQVKNTGTKSKKAQQERPQNKDGAMEALCKQGNFYNFEQQENVKVVDSNFKVLKVEIVDKVFEENFQTINNIGKRQDHYKITDEGMWQCIRTDQPFAFGMMKDVFLMKKKNAMKDELFVIKTPLGSQPYKTQNDAINECRSHLICQKLVKKFREEIEKAKEETNQDLFVPQVIYSDFLILQETNDRFWIAEKFFKGEFVKYNNNFGFINPDFDPLNKFAQAFSYYTFFISGGKYLVNDVQGVGNYFTDPAINTNTGDFDDTDLGLEGQQMFLVSFEWKHQLAYDYLNILDIQFEIDDGKKNK